MSLHGSTYYAYYAVSTFGSQNSAIGLATSSSMDPGTWTDQGQVFASTTGAQFNAIDPNVVIDEKGVPVLSFGTCRIKIRMHSASLTASVLMYRFVLGRSYQHLAN